MKSYTRFLSAREHDIRHFYPLEEPQPNGSPLSLSLRVLDVCDASRDQRCLIT